jgi:2,5-dioxopentanoate dehydrogenase
MELHGQNFIGSELSTGTGETFAVSSPLDSQPLPGAFHVASSDDVDRALQLADAAFPAFRAISPEQRAIFLEQIAREIENLGEELLQLAHRETGLPLPRLVGERGRTTNQLRLFAQIAREGSWVDARIDPAMPERQPAPRSDLRRMLIPLGPVVVFGASNFPFAFSVAGGDTASALATGNTVIVKAHERHPGTSELVAGAIGRALKVCDLPPGIFSMLHGTGKVVGVALVKHPLTRAVGFTGSRVAGRALVDVAAARPDPIPVFAEMSSLNPIFLLPEAVRELGGKIAEGLKNSITGGMGQFCTKPGLVFGLQSPDFEQFHQNFAARFETVAPATMLHSGIGAAYREGLARAEKIGGMKALAKSKESANETKTHGQPFTLRTEATNFLKKPELAEEVFGPYSVLISAKTMEELENSARHLEGQLTATIHGTPKDLQNAAKLLRILERKAGRLIINGFPTGVEVCPAMNHGGPYPATSDVRFTSVGTAALFRFVRPICYQDFPPALLPAELKDENPLKITRLVNGKIEQGKAEGEG